MAAPYMTAAQVGTYFVTQYYQMLQQSPDFVHQLYSDASTMIRIDGRNRETCAGMMQIHALVMSLRFSIIEIKTAHSLESWSGGVIVMVTGSVQMRDFNGRKRFAQTFFLAPQEKGYFVLNDIFHFIDEEQIHSYPVELLVQNNLNAKMNTSARLPKSEVPNYMMGGTVQAMVSGDSKENGTVDHCYLPHQRLQKIQEPTSITEENSVGQANGYLENARDAVHEVPTPPVEESAVEPQKHTYASILRVAKGQSEPTAVPLSSSKKNMIPASESHFLQQTTQSNNQQLQQPSAGSAIDGSLGVETSAELVVTNDRGEIKSVYVRGVPPTLSVSEIEEEFKKFGRLSPGGVAIRSVKDTDVCYAFVEFEDISGVQNAIQAATLEVSGHQVYVEERRPNSSFARGRRGRGRGSYQLEPLRGRHLGGRSFARGGYQGGYKGDNHRLRGNGMYRQANRQDRGFSGNQESWNGQAHAEAAA